MSTTKTPAALYEILARLSCDIQEALVEHHSLREVEDEGPLLDPHAQQCFSLFGTVTQIHQLRSLCYGLRLDLEYERRAAQSDYAKGRLTAQIEALRLVERAWFPASRSPQPELTAKVQEALS